MAKQTTAAVELGRVRRKLSSWRERHGGRGRPIPEELWRAAVDVASIAGVSETARVLGVDRERLVRRVGERPSEAPGAAVPTRTTVASPAFVELDAQSVLSRGKTVVRLTSREREQLEIEVEGSAMDVAAVARAFWERAR
jgi:hypothetical protein